MVFLIGIELGCQDKKQIQIVILSKIHLRYLQLSILQFHLKKIIGLGLEKLLDYLTRFGLTL